ncbi:MAG: GNAT family N-acetyltransferase [Bacteroidota bacterium]|nr:GNAT family N-acetyltransferase [Bacteroidota bacterium]MDQ6891030.1 GNAT family N-acetyltransferase [Bacteroidota bacterium]
MESYQIINTTKEDLEFIYSLFEEAIAYQKRKNFPVWNGFDKDVLIKDVEQKQHYKIIIEKEIACVFSVLKADPLIWQEKEKGDAIYLHRIVAAPKYKGQKQFEKVLKWSIDFARQHEIKFIRMDTWAHNANIIDYYKSYGFNLLQNVKTPDTPDLPIQNRNLEVALLEYTVNLKACHQP